jgi:RNA-directed DNA polymerase
MIREKFKWRTHKDESTNAGHRGGAVRSREEGSVMELDRRGCVVWLYLQVNQKWEEPCG